MNSTSPSSGKGIRRDAHLTPQHETPGFSDRGATKRKKPPIYRVMLHNDTFNRREYVVSVILKVVDGYTVDEAVNVMQVRLFLRLLIFTQ